MNARLHPLVAFFMAVVAVPLLAQQGNPPTTGPAAATQAAQSAAPASSASDEAKQAHVLGIIVTVSSDRLELKVEKAVEPNTESAAGLVGQTVAFVVDGATEKPADLKANDRVDLWFTENDGQRRAVRIVVAAAEGASSGGTAEPQGSSVPPNPDTPATGQPAPVEPQPGQPAAAAAPEPAASAVLPNAPAEASAPPMTAESNPTTSPAKNHAVGVTHHAKVAAAGPKQSTGSAVLPKPAAGTEQPVGLPPLPNAGAEATTVPPAAPVTGAAAASPEPAGSVGVAETVGEPEGDIPVRTSARAHSNNPLRFIGLGALAALAALVMLYFTLKAGHVELGIGPGNGGVG